MVFDHILSYLDYKKKVFLIVKQIVWSCFGKLWLIYKIPYIYLFKKDLLPGIFSSQLWDKGDLNELTAEDGQLIMYRRVKVVGPVGR